MQSPPSIQAAPAVSPEGSIAEEITCPLCDYNLRGLIEPRCPECGYRFEWADLTDPARRKHPYLFEHHRGLMFFLRTFINALRPLHFWRALRPNHSIYPWRLRWYWLIGVSLLFVALCGMFGMLMWQVSHWNNFYRSTLPTGGRMGQARLDYDYPVDFGWRLMEFSFERRLDWLTVLLTASLLLWPWLTLLVLSALRASMRQAKINSFQVMRCVVYSFDLCMWAGLAVLAVLALMLIEGYTPPNATQYISRGTLIVSAISYFWFVIRLSVAYRTYLQFRHPTAVVLCSQVILILLAAVILLQFPMFYAHL